MSSQDPVRAWLSAEWRREPLASEDALARSGGTAGNARMTAITGVTILLLLLVEGVTILFLGQLLTEHVVIGTILIPVVGLKLASTGYRFVRYYTGDRRYRRKGPPRLPLRLLAPVVVLSTVAVLATGVALILLGRGHGWLLLAHKASFVIWLVVTSVHVLAYLARAVGGAGAELARRGRDRVSGRTVRAGVLVGALAVGVVAGLLLIPYARTWSRERARFDAGGGEGLVAPPAAHPPGTA